MRELRGCCSFCGAPPDDDDDDDDDGSMILTAMVYIFIALIDCIVACLNTYWIMLLGN